MYFVATDFRLKRFNGKLYAAGKFNTIFRRYCDAFGQAIVCTRVIDAAAITDDDYSIDECVIKALTVASAESAMLHKIDKEIDAWVKKCSLVVARVPSIVGYRGAQSAFRNKVPLLAEAMGCPWDAYWNHGLYGKIVAPYMYAQMRTVMKRADYALYVTDQFLQTRYPTQGLSCSASNVNIKIDGQDALEERVMAVGNIDFTRPIFMTVAAIDVIVKGHRFVIEAIAKLKEIGIRATYYVVGGGDERPIRDLALKLGVDNQIVFTGNVSSAEVMMLLQKCDVYIQPSLQEGLPRSVIEAMSQGCLCLGSRTGGTPELLDDHCIFKPKSSSAIVEAYKWLSGLTIEELQKQVERNYDTARKYDCRLLEGKRNDFFDTVNKRIRKS